MRGAFAALVMSGAAVCALPSWAEGGLSPCAGIENAEQRLACYDELARAKAAPSSGTVADSSASSSFLTNAWKLGPADAGVRPLSDFVAYRPDYVILRWTNRPNSMPRSPATGRSSIPNLQHEQLKVQGSLKTELVSREAFDRAGLAQALGHVGVDSVRLWFAYTQKMNWQILNRGESRPISETDYEPEAILTFGTGNTGNGLKLVNLGISHESNGLDPKEHRGWSRTYVQGGWEWNRFSLLGRLWHVIPTSDDDNPNIRRFMGSGDLLTRYQSEAGYVTHILARANPSSKRGYVEVNWATPVQRRLGGLKFHVQLTRGYGETLIDYNHRQTTIGVGVSFGDW